MIPQAALPRRSRCAAWYNARTKIDPKQFVVDDQGNRVGVLLGMREYERVLDELEELESIHAYDAAKASGDDSISFDQAAEEIERDRP